MICGVRFNCLLLSSVTLVSCWQYYTSLKDYTLTNMNTDPLEHHSEYIYGDCERPDLIQYTHTHLNSMQLLGKLIIRGWLDIKRIPVCIKIIAKSLSKEKFTATSYNFQICVPRITYCHSHKRYKYFYYEWYIPKQYDGGMEWDIYFYGSANLEW